MDDGHDVARWLRWMALALMVINTAVLAWLYMTPMPAMSTIPGRTPESDIGPWAP